MKKALFLFALCSLLLGGRAQAQRNRAAYNGWLQYTGTYSLNERFDLNLGVQYRAYSGLTDKRLLLGLGLLQYNFKNAPLSVGAGYMYLQLQPYTTADQVEKFDNRENRFYQQVISTQKINRARLIHRYRIEERWTAAGFRLRFRYLASLRLPLGPKTNLNPKWYLALKDEIRILNKNLGGELLWMTQFDGGQNRSNYVAFILRHDFGWSADHPERRVRFLPQ
jgi:hypothetical protein